MWRRLLYSQLKALKSLPSSSTSASAPLGCISQATRLAASSRVSHSPSVSLFARHYASDSADTGLKKKAEDVIPIVTGHEREELEASLEGRDILDINHPVGPFGTKEEPAVIKSYYDERLVGCPGGEGEDEHDVVWFRLRKDVPHECPVCSQYFVLEVVGPGGSPDGYGDDDHQH
ncbi:cytochrome c oxidase subunit 5b-2, mitochondrial-like [Cucurbita moschata]|uniref:Cytochrome c oxidase subunit 5b-2, mitochondrial-like n=1 Tax=Cucurbita moschata TaxID=3662 RepID=A0A6J1GC81_CUCMO|nr:cytochrome c oxidase subunit 5b-2, mitochondrial-like [Cucurbita moschata]